MSPTILLDASRLLSRTERSTPTGIDRVCLAYAEWLVAHPEYRMVPVRARKGQLAVVANDWFRESIKDLRDRWNGVSDKSERAQDTALINALCAEAHPAASIVTPLAVPTIATKKRRAARQFFRARRTDPPAAMAYINVGHTGLDEPELLSSLQQAGIPRILMVHDLIPLTHPQHCRPGDDVKHARRMQHALTLGSHIITNSAYTADELALYANRTGNPLPPVDVAHLGLESHLGHAEPLKAARPYFVHVGTIEGRKNLSFILSVWRELAIKMGKDAPSLVLVGRYGWENEAELAMLHRCPELQGLVHQAEGMSDHTLTRIMLGARAVIAPSSVEGYDMPAVEASALGVPLIASDIAPHRELVGHARLISPVDGNGWMQAIMDYSTQRPTAPRFQPPTWDDHFAIIEQRVLSPLATKRQDG